MQNCLDVGKQYWSARFVGGLRNDAKSAMVCTANDLQEWKDFPKGLRVLLLDGDSSSAAEMRSKLEGMDYNGLGFQIPLSVLSICFSQIIKFCFHLFPLHLISFTILVTPLRCPISLHNLDIVSL